MSTPKISRMPESRIWATQRSVFSSSRLPFSLGFSLVELAVVLAIIAVMVGISTSASNIFAMANGQRVHTDFISAWVRAYSVFRSKNIIPADNLEQPTHRINQAMNKPLCNTETDQALSRVFIEQVGSTMELPVGRGSGEPHHYLVKDKDGIPRLLSVCFATVYWSLPNGLDSYANQERHVLIIDGLTEELASQLDVIYDQIANARKGSFRSKRLADSNSSADKGWDDPADYSRVYLLMPN